MKRFLCCLVFLVSAALLFGCTGGKRDAAVSTQYGFQETGYPIVTEPLTLTAAARRDALHGNWDETYWAYYAEKKSGIKIEFNYIDKQSWDQKKQLMFASNDLPDIILGGNGGITKVDEIQYGTSGLILPLQDLIEKHAPNIEMALEDYPLVRANITTPEGDIYALPKIAYSVDSVRRVWINSEWLDNLGMKMPETVEEMRKVLYAFKNNDPDRNGASDTYAISGVFDNYEADFRAMYLRAFGMLEADFIVDDKNVIYPPYTPEFKEYLKEMNFLYNEKLIDNEYFTQSVSEYKAKSSGVKVGLGCWSAPNVNGGMTQEAALKYVNIIPLTSKINSVKMWDKAGEKESVLGKTGCFVITSQCKYPEAAIRWADMWYTEEGGIVCDIGPQYGEFPASPESGYKVDENGEWTQYRPEGDGRDSWTFYNQVWAPASGSCNFGLQPEMFQKKKDVQNTPLYKLGMSFKEHSKDSKLNIMPSFYFDKDKQNELAIKKTEVQSYVKQMEAKFITGDVPLDAFDTYLETLKQYGVEDLISTYQENYEAFINNMN